jgi:hypothetical protein
VWAQNLNSEIACVVGGGASLNDTEDELVDLWHRGAKVFTCNGSYNWCLERNIKPHAQIVVDAQPSALAFVNPDKAGVRYLLSSQCHPVLWDAVKDRPLVGIWHSVDPSDPAAPILNEYYQNEWHGVVGGTTVGTRAIGLCRMLGFVRMHLFGMDACYIGGKGHAYRQPQNDDDQRITVNFFPADRPEEGRMFEVAPWHLKHLEDTLRFIKHSGDQFLLSVHGDGLLAYTLATHATMSVFKE